MIGVEVNQAFRIAGMETRERLREIRKRLPACYAALFRWIEDHIFDHSFTIEEARRRSGLHRNGSGDLTRLLGMPLADFVDQLRIETARRIIELGTGLIPAGRAAGAVGIARYRTWRRTYLRCTGEVPQLVRLPARLSPRFDDVSWHHACRAGGALGDDSGELSLDDARTLARRLHRLYPAALAGGLPAPRSLSPRKAPPGLTAAAPARSRSRGGGITLAEVREAVEGAAEGPLERLRRDAASLPKYLRPVLPDAAEILCDPELEVATSCLRAGLHDASITTKIGFFLGDTLSVIIEKKRVETAVGLIADRRFTPERLAEAVGLSWRGFSAAFERRTGARPLAVRKTLRETSGDAAYSLWRRAGDGELTDAEARTLFAYLRGLQPEAVERPEPAVLAIRHDVDPGCVEETVEVEAAIRRGHGSGIPLSKMLRPVYSAAHWYVHWIRDRLGCVTLDAAWADWQTANRALGKLLEHPEDRRSEVVREDRRFQSDAFLWLLVDCIHVRLFHDASESEHFADLGVAAAEARSLRDRRPNSAALLGLMRAFQGNALRRRNELTEASKKFREAFAAIGSGQVDPWIIGGAHSLQASLFERKGEVDQARRSLFQAGALMKKAGDELERLRCVIKRTSIWFAAAKDPTPLLTACIRVLDERYPFESDLRQSAHVNRMASQIYLADRLTGCNMDELRQFRLAMPPPSSPYAAMNRRQVDGLLSALSGDSEMAVARLHSAALWFDEHDIAGDGAVCWLQYAWAALDIDSDAASHAARTAFTSMQSTGFRSHGLEQVALKIHEDARRHSMNREHLRYAILMNVCPKLETRLTKPVGLP